MDPDPRYPIGKFSPPATFTTQDHIAFVAAIAELPQALRAAVHGLSDAQLDTAYRENGWTLRQTVHHVADSHMQASGRVRMALTEDWPPIAPYKENLWAELPDARTEPVEISLQLVDAIHTRWAAVLRSLQDAGWNQRGYTHPINGKQTMEQVTALYVWHGRHHTAQIVGLRQRMGW